MDGNYEQEIENCCIELEKIKQWIDQNKLHSNIKYLVSYGVIRASGTVETVMKKIIFDHLSDSCNAEALQYFNRHIIESSINPSTGRIEKLLSTINSNWTGEFQTVTKSTRQKMDLNSLVKLRNSFAHGNAITASIDDVIRYFNSSIFILEQLHKIIFRT